MKKEKKMRIDAYTKMVLTIIATYLILLVFKTFEPVPAKATNEIVRVDLVQIGGTTVDQSPYLFDAQELETIMVRAKFTAPRP